MNKEERKNFRENVKRATKKPLETYGGRLVTITLNEVWRDHILELLDQIDALEERLEGVHSN